MVVPVNLSDKGDQKESTTDDVEVHVLTDPDGNLEHRTKRDQGWSMKELIVPLLSVMCCQVMGLAAVVMTILSYVDLKTDDMDGRKRKKKTARCLSYWAVVTGISITAIMFVLFLMSHMRMNKNTPVDIELHAPRLETERIPGHDTVVCENQVLKINCSKDEIIRILSASYGRNDRQTCGDRDPSLYDNQQCHATASLEKVREICEGAQGCTIAASNAVFGDPCHGTYKRLVTTHQCVDESVTSERRLTSERRPTSEQHVGRSAAERVHVQTTCEHGLMRVSCHTDRHIRIVTARYGRSNHATCHHGPIKTIHCRAHHALQKVRRMCQGRRQCDILATNNVFTDPCVGTFKYLVVSYMCD